MTRRDIRPVYLLLVTALLVSGCALVNKQPTTMQDSLPTAEMSTRPDELHARADITVATARLAEDSGDQSRAMSLYSEAITLNPENADAHWRQAILFSGMQQADAATKAFEKAVELNVSNPKLYADYGYHLYLQERYPEAEAALRTAIRLGPGQARAHNNLGLVLAATGREQDAIASFRDAGCSEAEARSNLGFVQAMVNDLPQARSNYQAALAMDPSATNSELALKQLDKVVEHAESGVSLTLHSSPE